MPEVRRAVLIASPRGFCAGVERAIEVVEGLLAREAPPLYVRREIVHNRSVVDDLRARGVVFVDELAEVPDGSLVVFSAHGVAPGVWQEAEARGLQVIDATCPLVTKVHRQVSRHAAAGLPIVLIGHAGHEEVLGTMGEAPDAIRLVTAVADVDRLDLPVTGPVACVTQTTLGLDETSTIVEALRRRFPGLLFPDRGDICYATQNRQDAVKDLVRRGSGFLLVVGSPNSSNSVRLCEVAERLGVPARLISGPADLPWDELTAHPILGLTAGASAPEHLVQGVATALAARGWAPQEIITMAEDVRFRPPPELALRPDPRP
ncbi:MAG: 4-hydroxy-3-methylbut-2-enyl diphosphate reductase [Candidatus Krumholzibacteriia bacterium]